MRAECIESTQFLTTKRVFPIRGYPPDYIYAMSITRNLTKSEFYCGM